MIIVSVSGVQELRMALTQLVDNTNALLTQEVGRATESTRAIATRLCPVAFGRLKASIRKEITHLFRRGEVLIDKLYGQWVEGVHHDYLMGRAPGKWPPRLPILLWVLKKKIHVKMFGYASQKSASMATFIVRRSIGKKGTKAQPFLRPAFEYESALFVQNCNKIVERAGKQAHLLMTRTAGR